MKKTFKKRFRSEQSMVTWASHRFLLSAVTQMHFKYYITKSANGKKEYHHLEGTYTPKVEV